MAKRFKNGEKNRLHPNKPANQRRGTDVDECSMGMSWCRDCKGTLEDTFKCMSRANQWLASLPEDKKKRALEEYNGHFYPILYI